MTEKVLILDDEVVIAFDLALTVESSGRSVIGPATSIDQARSLAQENKPEIALLDVNIRGEKVWPLAEDLRKAGCRVIFCSADAAPTEPDFLFADCTYLTKPALPQTILKALEN